MSTPDPGPTSRTRIVVVQHALETNERSNTARHAAAALASVELRVHGLRGTPVRLEDLEGAWLLWPGEPLPGPEVPRPATLVALDGSWSQARRMLQRLPVLGALRRLSLPPPADRRSLRAAPDGGMSTIEALAEALAFLEGDAVAAPLRAAHEALVQRQLALRGYVGPMR